MIWIPILLALAVFLFWTAVQGARKRTGQPQTDSGETLSLFMHTVRIANGWLEWKAAGFKGFRIQMSSITSVTVDQTGPNQWSLRVIGGGTELGRVAGLLFGQAKEVQEWILTRLDAQARAE